MKKLTVTFDNGPDPECTPQVLDVLRDRGIRASFFVCGNGNTLHPALPAKTAEAQALLARAREEGHWIGNHTLTHTLELGTTRDSRRVEREIGGNEAILGDLNDKKLFRPYMSGGLLSRRIYSPEAIQYLCDEGYTVVMFNCVPRDWEIPDEWPEEAFRIAEDQDWTVLIVHDVARYGGMNQLARFLDLAIERDVEIVQEFPDDPACVPIADGRVVGSLDGLVCGDEPEPPHPIAEAAASTLEENA